MSDLKEVTQRVYDEIANQGNLDLIDEIFDDDFVEHEELPAGMPRDKEGVRMFFTMSRNAFPDFRMTVEDIIQEGNKVVARVRASGTHKGEFMGMPATGNKFDVALIDISEFRDDKLIGHWGVMDMAAMMEQLGVTGPPA